MPLVTKEMEAFHELMIICYEFGWALESVRGLSARDFMMIRAWLAGRGKAMRESK